SDETSLTINDKPTINTSTISTPSAGSTLSSVTISVNANGSNITSQVWKKDGNNIDPNSLTFQAGQTYSLTYEVTNGCGTSSKNYTVTIPSGGTSSYHIRCISGNYGNNGGTVIELNEDSGCYYTTSTTPLFYSDWRLEDSDNHVVPLRTEFSFFVWGNENQLYNNNNGNTLTSIQPLQHCGWDRTISPKYSPNCTTPSDYNGPYYTLYIYQKNGDWYASENCGGCAGIPHHVKSTANVNGDTRQLHVVNSNCYSVNETSNLHNGRWHLEDCIGNTLPMIAEFNFTTQNNQPYNNNPVEGQYVYDGLFANCWNYNDQNIHDHCILYIYKRDGVWYASEDESKCQAAGGSTLSITPNTAQKVACEDITFLASESSNSLEWYYGSTKLSDGNGIT
ncbi:MAG: hypothetical protein UE068_10730, partial [Paludibacteraceae bacterium]|nr:hypothetical protein [Paludibacteraceae bacterium]